jgi:prevent-host-death family protein
VRSELVTTLKRRATEIIDGLAEHKEPVLITQHGQPAAFLVGVDEFSRMQKKLEVLEGIARGEKSILEGRVVPHADAKERMARWLE